MSTFSMESLDYDPLNVVRQDIPDRMPLRLYGRAARCVDHSIMAMSALFHAAREGAIIFPDGTLGDPAEIFEQQLLEAFDRADALEEYAIRRWPYRIVWWMAVKAWL